MFRFFEKEEEKGDKGFLKEDEKQIFILKTPFDPYLSKDYFGKRPSRDGRTAFRLVF